MSCPGREDPGRRSGHPIAAPQPLEPPDAGTGAVSCPGGGIAGVALSGTALPNDSAGPYVKLRAVGPDHAGAAA
ncbi:MAG: hypothetical protein ACYCZM_04850 [Acidimicrobiales bacterium]